jgi:hypothetical protein
MHQFDEKKQDNHVLFAADASPDGELRVAIPLSGSGAYIVMLRSHTPGEVLYSGIVVAFFSSMPDRIYVGFVSRHADSRALSSQLLLAFESASFAPPHDTWTHVIYLKGWGFKNGLTERN